MDKTFNEQYHFKQLAVHGRFQPPLHVNHWNYIRYAFDSAAKVSLYITNPYLNESSRSEASWRNTAESNPFTFEERAMLFGKCFQKLGIVEDRYEILPLNVTDDAEIARLPTDVPMIVNVYSEWSQAKAKKFKAAGKPVILLAQPRLHEYSGTKLREQIAAYQNEPEVLQTALLQGGLLPEAVCGLLELVQSK